MAQYQSFPGAAGDSRTLDKLKALHLPDLAGRSFLDVGCNEGFFCGFAHFQKAQRSVGVDHSRPFIDRARRRFPGCEFHHQGWEALPTGPFDVILLASALHYAEDQPALIHRLVESLSADGLLVLELGIVSSAKNEWVKVKRGIDERVFPTMPKLREVLRDYAWKWMGPSVSQSGDPVPRHVVHISRRRPLAYLLLQPPAYGKTTIAASLFAPAHVPVVSGDQLVDQVAKGKLQATPALREAVARNYSPFAIDQNIQRVFDLGLAEELVHLWLNQSGGGDFALDVYVPVEHHATVERILGESGYLPVLLRWERCGPRFLSGDALAEQAEAFYLSMVDDPDAGPGELPKPAREPVGFVDEVKLAGGNLRFRGWAVDSNGSLPAQLAVRMGGEMRIVERFEKQLRPDVQRHLQLEHALVGFVAGLEVEDGPDCNKIPEDFEVWPARDGRPYDAPLRLAAPVKKVLAQEPLRRN
jgi:SAM-dependent methyltransferase